MSTMTTTNGYPPYPTPTGTVTLSTGEGAKMKQCSICGLAKDDNPAHGDTYDGPGKHSFSKATKSADEDELSVGLNDESPVAFGGAVKALGIETIDNIQYGMLEGPAVLFTKSDDTDIAKEFFNKDTDFFFETDDFKAVRPVIYDHGLDGTLKAKKLSRATLEIQDDDVWFKTQLDLSDKYNRFIYKLAEMGELGSSTGSAPHLIQREAAGKSTWIKAWPIVELSLTPKPVEWKTKGKVLALKSYSEIARPAFVKSIEGMEGAKEILPPPSPEEVAKTINTSAMKSIFETKLAERTESIYDLQSTFHDVCRDIEQAAEASDITGVVIDVDAKVLEASSEYLNRLAPLASKQIKDWVESKQKGICTDNYFYLKSLMSENPLQTFLSIEDSLVTEGHLDEHSAQVVSAIAEYSRMTKSLTPKVDLWQQRCEEKFEFRSNDSTKSGRTLSKATLAKLAEVEAEFEQALANGATTLDGLKKLIEAATPKKSISEAEFTLAQFEIAKQTHEQEMAGLSAAA